MRVLKYGYAYDAVDEVLNVSEGPMQCIFQRIYNSEIEYSSNQNTFAM